MEDLGGYNGKEIHMFLMDFRGCSIKCSGALEQKVMG